MSEPERMPFAARRLSRRAALLLGGQAGLAAIGLVLVGCDGDDDDDGEEPAPTPTPAATPPPPEEEATASPEVAATPPVDAAPTEEPAPAPAPAEAAAHAIKGGMVIEEVAIADANSTVTLFNTGDSPVNLDGWYICQFPNYWPVPALTVAAGGRIVVHMSQGENTETDLFANRAFSTLKEDKGEVGLYASGQFDSPDAMRGYVDWNAEGHRAPTARAAGLWGDTFLTATLGSVIRWNGAGSGADSYTVEGSSAASPPDNQPPDDQPPAGY